MPPVLAAGAFRSRCLAAAPGTWILEPLEAGQPRIVIAGHVGSRLPEMLHGIELRPARESAPERWQLVCREGEFEFEARGIERLEALPRLFDPLLAGHTLGARDRVAVRILLKLLRLPGGAWLLRTWHGSRR
jgi:hypothetical protein